jgi:D-glycero-alpha-D-manno-heptose-7-phosphate kinase
MIITRTPFRVSFAGGGSDLRDFYHSNGYGAVLSATIKKYMYIIIHPYFHDKIRIKYSVTEDVDSVDSIKHPIVKECLKRVKVDRGVEIASIADIPSGTGLGSSSAFTVGLLNALYAYKGVAVPRERLAREACEIEIDVLKEPIGKQDQYASAYGNINYIRFNRDESVEVSPLLLTDSARLELEKKLCLCYMGGSRKSGEILCEQRRNMSDGDKIRNLKSMVDLAGDLRDGLLKNELAKMGQLLHKGWLLKKELAVGITNPELDDVYQRSMNCGATGGKLLGAGGNGFMLFYVNDVEKFGIDMGRQMLPFQLDREGSKVIFFD